MLADELARFTEKRGGDDELVQKVLNGKGPRERAAELIAGTTLFEVDARKKIAAAGIDGINSSKDPLIQLARLLEPEYRALRETY